jgi:aspartyl-tRNA(Asn)/glutamyl-tRNA(Gln) amidotransferase subunit A
LLAAGKTSSVELSQLYLARIAAQSANLNAFITSMPSAPLAQARAADRRAPPARPARCRRADGAQGHLLHRGLAHHLRLEDARQLCRALRCHVVEQFRAAGAVVCLGKTNMDEFAMGSSNETSFSARCATRGTKRVPGGSAPAARPRRGRAAGTRGHRHRHRRLDPPAGRALRHHRPQADLRRVSRYGMIAFASSLDQAGPMARSAEDCALLLNADGRLRPARLDQPRPPEDYARDLDKPLKGLRIGLPKEFFGGGLSPDVARRDPRGRSPSIPWPRRAVPRGQPAQHRAVGAGLLCHRPGRVLVQPERASTACATATARRYGDLPTCTTRAPRASAPRSSAAS